MKSNVLLSMLKTSSMIVFFVLFFAVFAYPADITGTWKSEFDTQIGVQKYTFKFEKADDGIKGKAISDIGGQITEVVLTEVKLDSNHVSFVENLPFQEMELVISYEGTVSGNEMKLTRNVGDFASEELTAKREE